MSRYFALGRKVFIFFFFSVLAQKMLSNNEAADKQQIPQFRKEVFFFPRFVLFYLFVCFLIACVDSPEGAGVSAV